MFYVCRNFCVLVGSVVVLKVTSAAQTDAPASEQVKSSFTDVPSQENSPEKCVLLLLRHFHSFTVHIQPIKVHSLL